MESDYDELQKLVDETIIPKLNEWFHTSTIHFPYIYVDKVTMKQIQQLNEMLQPFDLTIRDITPDIADIGTVTMNLTIQDGQLLTVKTNYKLRLHISKLM